MKATERNSTPTRRSILSGVALATTALVAAPAALAAEHPDAELLDVLTRFDALERQINATFSDDDSFGEWDRKEAELRVPLKAAQEPLVDRICELQATTREALRARAVVVIGEDLELRRRVMTVDTNGIEWCVNDRLLAALLRDLIGGVAA